MQDFSSSHIRKIFLEFFQEKGHELVESSSLIPNNDPSLLFTNAGMVPFKDMLLGVETRDYTRAVSSQRCLRVGGKHDDLDNVGYTARHHTFFEMLGNFSFGDYFKKEAIEFAWELLTDRYNIPPEKLWITVHKDDQESEKIWIESIGVDPNRLSRLDDDENFWTMGDTGPCGPCSEIYYDHGDHIQGEPPEIGSDPGDRFIEIWNLVFTQFDRSKDGTLSPLPNPCVDTGMGLERIAAVLQDKHNNFNTDGFTPLIEEANKITKLNDLGNSSLKVIADHLRSSSFLIAEGIVPSNEGRGYVLRRIIRRALRHANKIGHEGPILSTLSSTLVKEMGNYHSLLKKNEEIIKSNLLQEEEQFSQTLSQGMLLLEEEIKKLDGKLLSGEVIFKLYDTYGFPVDMTSDFARENSLEVDIEGYEELMSMQRERARSSSAFSSVLAESISISGKTDFLGYENSSSSSKVLAISNTTKGRKDESLSEGEEGVLFLDKTPFYAEAGGQVGDEGHILGKGFQFNVVDTQKVGDHFGHIGVLKKGNLRVGDSVDAKIDENLRSKTVSNHSATHLLQASLRKILGNHVEQKGSLVDSNKLRFDFTHNKSLSEEEKNQIEDLINLEISKNTKSIVETMSMQEAQAKGAIAFFGDKYGDEVRVLNLGEGFSIELCGGTHVKETGQIEFMKITSESGISSGVRRIEAVTGEGAKNLLSNLKNSYLEIGKQLHVETKIDDPSNDLDLFRSLNEILLSISKEVSTSVDQVQNKINQLIDENRSLNEELGTKERSNKASDLLKATQSLVEENKKLKEQKKKLTSKNIGSSVEDLIEEAIDIQSYKLVTKRYDGMEASGMREAADRLRLSLNNGIVVLISVSGDKIPLIVACSKGLDIDAKQIMEYITNQLGGSGGGRPDFAQGGVENIEDIDVVLSSIPDFILSISN